MHKGTTVIPTDSDEYDFSNSALTIGPTVDWSPVHVIGPTDLSFAKSVATFASRPLAGRCSWHSWPVWSEAVALASAEATAFGSGVGVGLAAAAEALAIA